MKNPSLARDYLVRARKRLSALDVLVREKAWPDVVRESQELVELALKGVLRLHQIEAPRVHDVSDIFVEHRAVFSTRLQSNVLKLCRISKRLRRDRELAFYGSEDLTPSEFYKEKDALEARRQARWVIQVCEAELKVVAPGARK